MTSSPRTDDAPTPRGALAGIMKGVGVVLVVAVLYIASSGPMYAISARLDVGYESVEEFYEPAGWIATRLGVGKLHNRWWNWWVRQLNPIDDPFAPRGP